jgi:glycosyltransferase involved in cell wall biosynthesis
VTGRVLLLTPSRGLGGGIERYVATLEWAFTAQDVAHKRVDLRRPGPAGHRRLLAEAAACLGTPGGGGPGPARLVAAHRALLPVAAMLARRPDVAGVSVICHGSDVWGTRAHPRWYAESRLMRRADVRVVAVSSFTAGALATGCRATILPPGLSGGWFGELSGAATTARPGCHGVELLTAFRLADWRDKGLPQLIEAVDALGRRDVSLTICGSGSPDPELLSLVRRYPWCTVLAGLTDGELAARLAGADLFVLATRTRPGRRPCGEGFGLVLLEAQVAGTAVVAPAHGGSADAYLSGVTGLAPTDESVTALTGVLDRLLKDPARLRQMGARAAGWAGESFSPDKYAALAVDRLL